MIEQLQKHEDYLKSQLEEKPQTDLMLQFGLIRAQSAEFVNSQFLITCLIAYIDLCRRLIRINIKMTYNRKLAFRERDWCLSYAEFLSRNISTCAQESCDASLTATTRMHEAFVKARRIEFDFECEREMAREIGSTTAQTMRDISAALEVLRPLNRPDFDESARLAEYWQRHLSQIIEQWRAKDPVK